MPGTSAGCSPLMMWHVEVPMTSSSWPGSIARAAGAVTCASTLPAATAMPSGRPVTSAARAGRPPTREPSPTSSGGSHRQAGPLGRARSQTADAGAQLDQRRPLHLVLGERGEALVERGEELAIRERAVLVDRLVSGGAEVARLLAAELPDDPVGALDPALHALVELRVLLEDLQRLGELPLARDPA